MGLIEYNDAILEFYFQILPKSLVNQVNIGHKNQISLFCTFSVGVKWTKIVFLGLNMQFFDIHRTPRYILVVLLVKFASFGPSFFLTGVVESLPFQMVDF